MKKQFLGIAVAASLLVGAPLASSPVFAAELYQQCQQDWGKLTDQVEGREFKFLIDPNKTAPKTKDAMKDIWGQVKGVLEKNGVTVTEREKKPFSLSTQVKTFFDTPNGDLWKKGYLVRATINNKKGYYQSPMKIVVKRINLPSKTIIQTPLVSATGKKGTPEDNIGIGPNGKLISYVEKGVSFQATRADLGDMNLADFAKYVPELAKLGLPADTKLVATPAFGKRARPGFVQFPGLDKPTSVSMEAWSRTEDGKPIVYDYSFGYDGDFNAMAEAHKNAEKATMAINKELGEKLGMPNGGQYIGSKVRVLLNQPVTSKK